MILTLTTSLAEEKTTNNLITNGNFETGNANGWTTNGDVQVLNDCCELNGVSSNYDLEFGDSGSIEQQFNLTTDTINQTMLNNGITLNSTVEVQNGECGVAGCWGGSGNADTFTITLKIKDSDGNVLATNTTIRTDVTGINGANFTDRLIYNGQDSNLGNLNIAGTDANAPSNLGGANVDNIVVTMTYDDEVISNEIIQEIATVFEELQEETFKEIKLEEKFTFEIKEEPKLEEVFEVEESIEIVSMPEKEPEIIEEKPEVMEETMIEEKLEEEMITEEIMEEAVEEKEEEIQEEEMVEESSQEAPEKEIKTKVAKKKTKKPKIDKIMAKVDEQIKDSAKNLTIKNIIKLDAMQNDQVSLSAYNNTEFYKPKDIYLNQIELFDNRSIYANVDLVEYTANDIMEVKIKTLNEIKSKKRLLLLELQELKNG
tara:strand:+ start:498 stop:1784 length:1287 start_codon:yes stop_codon:yes gene_type:complete